MEFATTEAAQRAVSLQNVTVLGRPTKVEMSSAARGAMGAPPPRGFDDRGTNFGNAGFNSNQSFSNGTGFGGNNFNQNFGGLASAATDILHNPFLQLKFQQIQQGLSSSFSAKLFPSSCPSSFAWNIESLLGFVFFVSAIGNGHGIGCLTILLS